MSNRCWARARTRSSTPCAATRPTSRERCKRLGLKFAPKLKFRADESFEEADRIEKLLNDPKVARDLDGDDDAAD